MSFMELFGGWIIGFFLFILAIAAIGGFILLGKKDFEAKQAFMTQCREDHKDYECTYMWRSGEPDTIPVFIPIPTGR